MAASLVSDAEREVINVKSNAEMVYSWRYDQFFLIGYTPEMAELLAHTKIDLAQTRRLKGQGCPLDLIARILYEPGEELLVLDDEELETEVPVAVGDMTGGEIREGDPED